MSRQAIYVTAKARVVSRPNGLWMAQERDAEAKGTKTHDPWVDVQNMPVEFEEAMFAAKLVV